MHDRPSAPELIAAARMYLEKDLIPTLTDQRLRFQTLVAVNVLSIVERELHVEEEQLLEEWAFLGEVLNDPVSAPPRLDELRREVRQGNDKLCKKIREGEFDAPARFEALAREVRRFVERKLQVANPKYLAGFAAVDAQ